MKINGYCSYTTLYLKQKIEKELGIETKFQALIIDGKTMKDSETLNSNGIYNGKELQLSIQMSVNEFLQLKINNRVL